MMISKDGMRFIQRPRNVTPVIRKLIVILNKSGIGPSKTLNVLGDLTSGLENIGFGSQDVGNMYCVIFDIMCSIRVML